MPLYNYSCNGCEHKQEHMIYPNESKELNCPKCESSEYAMAQSRFKTNIEYSRQDDFIEHKVQPHVDETFEKMGREAAQEDTKTMENIFGSEAVENSVFKDND